MNKTTLCLIFITQFFGNIYGEIFHFKDGTTVEGEIFTAKGFEADSKGVILTVNNKIYIHHYPYKKGSSGCAPPMYYPYFSGMNPHGISRCVPTRISFFNFETFSLMDVKDSIARSKIPYSKKLEAVKMINYVGVSERPEYMKPSLKRTKKWEANVKIWGNYYIDRNLAVWGKDLIYVRPRKNINPVNGSFKFGTKKARW
jgi:hypothetical protein